ncbi:unnamed protein product [Rhizophagus irregularis]|nr:unnamed protein product [Rhizophagus irregularis]
MEKAHALLSTSKNQRKIEQEKTDLELHKINARKNERKRPAEESFTTITPPPNLRSHTPPPLQVITTCIILLTIIMKNRPKSRIHQLRPLHQTIVMNLIQGKIQRNTNLSCHGVTRLINNVSENDWVTQNGHNISTDFRNFQLKSIEKLKTNPTLSYAKEISLILCSSSIIHGVKFTNSEGVARVADLVIIEYSRFLNIFDCVQIVSRNFFTYLSSESYIEDKKLDEDTFIHRYCHRAFISLS